MSCQRQILGLWQLVFTGLNITNVRFGEMKMRKILKSFWGCIPAAFLLICIVFITIIEAVTGCTLRVITRSVLIFAGVGGLGLLLLWANLKYHAFVKKSDKLIHHIIAQVIKIFSVSIFAITFLVSSFVVACTYNTEHIVIRNDIKMVATVRSFLEEQVDYYQYKNPFFYGKWLGHENYGNGSGDPLAETPKRNPKSWIFYDLDGNVIESGTKSEIDEENTDLEQKEKETILRQKSEIKKLDISVLDNREDELVFNISIDDYIESYNGYYWKDKKSRYLLPSSNDNWRTQILDTSIHSKHETVYYNFTEDEKVWPLPTISVYVPANSDYIQEITLNFDDHSYTEAMYKLYEEMCYYTLKVFFPDLSDDKITQLYTTLNSLAYDNLVPHEQGYSSNSVPCALYHKDGIGLYPYFAVGECVHLCIIPVTEETINDFEKKGVEIYEIE